MGLRPLLRSNNLVPNPVRHFCGPARQQRKSARGGDAMSDCGVDGPAVGRMLRLGSMAATILIHDHDSCCGAAFERRLWHLGIAQVRTPLISAPARHVGPSLLQTGPSVPCLSWCSFARNRQKIWPKRVKTVTNWLLVKPVAMASGTSRPREEPAPLITPASPARPHLSSKHIA